MNQSTLARRLGLSKGQVSKLKAQGMPTDSVDAALAWRARNLDPSWMKSAPARRVPEPIEELLKRLPSFSPNDPSFLVAALIDAGFRGFTGEQARQLAGIIVNRWMAEATHAIGDENAGFVLPDCWKKPGNMLAQELQALIDDLLTTTAHDTTT